MKINSDGVFNIDTIVAGLGGVARNHLGQLLGVRGRKLICQSIEEAEALAVLLGLEGAATKGWH